MTARQWTVGRSGWRRPKLAPAGSRLAAIRWHEGADDLWVGSTGTPLELASDVRPWRLRDFHWAASGAGLILVLGMVGREQRWLAYLDLRSGAVSRLTPDTAADARYVGQARGAKPIVLAAHRQSLGDGFDLQAVTPTGAVVAEWQGPGRPVRQWLADGVD